MARPTREDIARRRQAVQIGLSSTLDAAQVDSGLRLWDGTYSQAKPAAIIEYVAQLAAMLDLPPKLRHEMRMGLFQALVKYDAGRETPPPPKANGHTAPSGVASSLGAGSATTAKVATEPAGRPEQIVFERLSQEIFSAVREAGGMAQQDFRASLENQRDSALSEFDRNLLISGARDGRMFGIDRVGEAGLARMVHVLYVAACEAVGPVMGDRVLTQAVTAAEALPQARRFSPRRFL